MKRFNNEILSPHVRLHLDRLQLLLASALWLSGRLRPRPHSTGSAPRGMMRHDCLRSELR